MCKNQAAGCPKDSEVVLALQAAQTDLAAKRREYYFALPGFLRGRVQPLLQVRDDLPILLLFWNVSIASLPAAVAVFAIPAWSYILGPLYLICSYILFLERYLLALHYSEHRKLFKKEHYLLNGFAPVVLAPLFGVPGGLYRFHHCVMHHVEGNWFPKDLSSTEPYQRDNFGHFLLYWLRYLVGIWVELPIYAIKAHKWQMALECLGWEALYIAVTMLLWHVNKAATVWTLLVPLVISSFALMFGNWSQHIFVDPANPRSPHGMSYSCIGFSGNQQSFNDGYHTAHHLNSRLHWTELPQHYMDSVRNGTAKGLAFEGIGFFEVGFAVFTRNLDTLARCFVQTHDRRGTHAEVVDMLRRRLQPLHSHH